jgi:hypothetical protein
MNLLKPSDRTDSGSSPTHTPRDSGSAAARDGRTLFAAEVILHAGDVCVASFLEELSSYAPVHAVLGNDDRADVSAWGASETTELDLAGLRVAMIHDTGPREGRLAGRPKGCCLSRASTFLIRRCDCWWCWSLSLGC